MVIPKWVPSSSWFDGVMMMSDRMLMMMYDLKFMNQDEHNDSHGT